MKEPTLSTCERTYVCQAASTRERIDGRSTYDFRDVRVTFGVNSGSCEVAVGNTRALAYVLSEVTAPKPSRPTEGILHVNVELSPMAAPHFEVGRQSTAAVELTRLLERCISGSRCVDMESLCIVAGEKVWALRVDIRILNHDGNMVSCASIAAMAALSHFRRPDVSVSGDGVQIHSPDVKEPVPLTVYHMPLCITFALFQQGEHLLLDPTNLEELVMDGKMVFGMNAYREICTLHMNGRILLSKEKVLHCSSVAAKKVGDITDVVKQALAQDAEQRVARSKVGFAVALQDGLLSNKWQDATGFTSEARPWTGVVSKKKSQKKKPKLVEDSCTVMGPGTVSLSEEGPMQWDVADTTSEPEETATTDIEVPKRKPRPAGVETIELGEDSEEEEVIVLQPETEQGNGLQKARPQRGWYKPDAFF